MKSFCFLILLLFSQTTLQAQTELNKDSIQGVWKESYKKIATAKSLTDSTSNGFAFDKRTHRLLAATSYSRNRSSESVIKDVHFYYHNDSLLWFKVMIQYPRGPKEKSYVEYYYLDGQLIKGLERGKIVSDYSYLLPQAFIVLKSGYKLLNSKKP
jgi:hypothetical protein